MEKEKTIPIIMSYKNYKNMYSDYESGRYNNRTKQIIVWLPDNVASDFFKKISKGEIELWVEWIK